LNKDLIGHKDKQKDIFHQIFWQEKDETHKEYLENLL